MFPFIQCQCFDKRRGVYLLEKVSVFIKIRVIFWPEISALGVSLNFDNESMRSPLYLKSDCNPFARLYISCQMRDGNLEEFFTVFF